MIDYYFERERRVLLARISGVFDGQSSDALDDTVARFAATEKGLSAVYDFSGIEQVAIPASRMAERARQPPVVDGRRLIVASRAMGGVMARSFSELQANAGKRAPMVVRNLEEAYVVLGLNYRARFEPITIA